MIIPPQENTTVNLIDKWHESQSELPRPHLGVSLLGHECSRFLWYSFRWAVREQFSGRMLRLFRRGQNEELTIVKDLRAIGVDIRSTTGNQSRVDFGKHVSGSLDGIIESGLPEAPKARHICEMKTHSQKSFDDLVKNGLEKSKPMHKTQLNTYMFGKDIDRGLYIGINKNTDEIYTERIELDKDAAVKAIERGQSITMRDTIPERMSENPTWYACKWCPAHSVCHEAQPIKEVNCRTCAHATAMPDSTWHCEKWNDTIPLEAQYTGCEAHVVHPHLVPWERKDANDEWHVIYMVNSKPVLNGAEGFKSTELLANPSACAENDAFMQEMRKTTDAKVIG